jgi:hypothetical protein
MMDLLRFNLPPDYVQARVRLLSSELRRGFDDSWIDARSVVALAAGVWPVCAQDAEVLERLSYLLSDELDAVPDLVGRLDHGGPADREVWCYLAVAWVSAHRDVFGDPFDSIEHIAADYEYPEELLPLIKFMPAQPGEDTSPAGMQNRLRRYLEHQSARFAGRRGSSSTLLSGDGPS